MKEALVLVGRHDHAPAAFAEPVGLQQIPSGGGTGVRAALASIPNRTNNHVTFEHYWL